MSCSSRVTFKVVVLPSTSLETKCKIPAKTTNPNTMAISVSNKVTPLWQRRSFVPLNALLLPTNCRFIVCFQAMHHQR
jgi:hypothetical protein